VVATVDERGVQLALVAKDNPQVDIWGAERRTELFKKVFGLPVMIRWAGQPA
jgi:hypothetical protein